MKNPHELFLYVVKAKKYYTLPFFAREQKICRKLARKRTISKIDAERKIETKDREKETERERDENFNAYYLLKSSAICAFGMVISSNQNNIL